VVACSALKRAYRDRIRRLAPSVRFVFLDGTKDVIRARLEQRKGHYMPSGLIDSQFSTLERPSADERDVITVTVEWPVEGVVQRALAALK
jgi:gluconokinase